MTISVFKPRRRVNVRCAWCGWSTSRAPRVDENYGLCRRCDCGAPVHVARPRPLTVAQHFRQADQPAPPAPAPRYRTVDATWPELIAAELDRRDPESPDA